MPSFGDPFARKRAANAKALGVFGVNPVTDPNLALTRTVHQGNGVIVYTVGYERRSPSALAGTLRDLGAELVLDVRENPTSRRAGFRAADLRHICAEAGLAYESWPALGSTQAQRDALHESGDLESFKGRYRTFLRRYRRDDLARLQKLVAGKTVALFCFERDHDSCHRSVLAELLHENAGITVVAVL